MAIESFAQGKSPAGGGALEFNRGRFAVAKGLKHKLKEFTIELWVYPKDTLKPEDDLTIFAKPGSYELRLVGGSYPLIANREGKFALLFEIQGKILHILSEKQFRIHNKTLIGGWHHICVNIHPTKFSMCVDGFTWAGGPNVPVQPSDSDFYLGGNPFRKDSFFLSRKEASYFDGWIDEVRISNVRRYDKIGFNFPLPGRFKPDNKTVALWHFDEPNRHKDSSIHANHFSLRRKEQMVEQKSKLTTTWGEIKKE